jgi:hypothetical protein
MTAPKPETVNVSRPVVARGDARNPQKLVARQAWEAEAIEPRENRVPWRGGLVSHDRDAP